MGKMQEAQCVGVPLVKQDCDYAVRVQHTHKGTKPEGQKLCDPLSFAHHGGHRRSNTHLGSHNPILTITRRNSNIARSICPTDQDGGGDNRHCTEGLDTLSKGISIMWTGISEMHKMHN